MVKEGKKKGKQGKQKEAAAEAKRDTIRLVVGEITPLENFGGQEELIGMISKRYGIAPDRFEIFGLQAGEENFWRIAFVAVATVDPKKCAGLKVVFFKRK